MHTQPYGQPGINDIHKQPLPPLPGPYLLQDVLRLLPSVASKRYMCLQRCSEGHRSNVYYHFCYPLLLSLSITSHSVGAKEGGLFDDPSYVNVDKSRPQVAAANGSTHRDAFDMSE